MKDRTREGYIYGLIAYGWWGFMPLYFHQVKQVHALELLAYRIALSLIVLSVLVSFAGRWPDLKAALRNGKTMRTLLLTSILIACNWLIYIHSALSERIREAALGYFLTPIVSVLIGLFIFREHLRKLQWLSLMLAVFGLALFTHVVGGVPWVAPGLALTFSLYGSLRKTTPIDGMLGLLIETLFLAPLAAGYILYQIATDSIALGVYGPRTDIFILLSGIVTTVPLATFAQAARRLPMSALGFLQYLSPSIQFLLAVAVLGETFQRELWFAFAFIWAALAIFSYDTLVHLRRQYRLARESACQPSA